MSDTHATDPVVGTDDATALTSDAAGTPGPPDDPEVIRRRIEHTREELGETVAALSEKTDVKAQASMKADELKERVHDATESARAKADSAAETARRNPLPFAAAGVVVLLVLARIRRRRRARRRQRALVEDALQHSLAGGLPVAALLVDAASGSEDRRGRRRGAEPPVRPSSRRGRFAPAARGRRGHGARRLLPQL